MLAFSLIMRISTTVEDAFTQNDQPYSGTRGVTTSFSFGELRNRLESAIEANGMFVVTASNAGAGAKRRGVTILGNLVLGVYRNDFAVRMLKASVASGIEAPLRFYVTANPDKIATLTYRNPIAVFGVYGSAVLNKKAAEINTI
ncbi:MAG: DUF302 domain-containing protein [Pseudomonadota bacterium]|nr:DUF302 domain-containing protein [Pseudomonadota bacterium]